MGQRWTRDALTQILAVQGPEVRTFLQDSVFLGPLTADLCDDVLSRKDSQLIIDQLVRQELLQPVPEEPGAFRPQPLLADALRGFVHDDEPHGGSALHRSAARWHERRGDAKRALGHHLAAGDYAKAAELILAAVPARPPSDLDSFFAVVTTPRQEVAPGNGTAPLSRRELEVLELLTAGHSNKKIARQLHISEGTIKSHCYKMFRKLGAGNRTTAVAQGRRLGLIH